MANNGYTSSSLGEKMLDAFEILAQAEVNSAQFDKTVTGIIISCEDEATGRYKVQYQDAIFYAYSTALDVTYNKGVSVQVKIPNNDFSGRKMIIGTVEENGIDYGTIVEDPLLRYEYVGIDCINSIAQYNLGSYWTSKKNSSVEDKTLEHFNITVYDKEKNINSIDLNEDMAYDNIKKGNSILLGATFKTDIIDQQKFKGDYGIKYTLTFHDVSNVEATIDRYYIIDIDKMSGDPYSLKEATDQIIPFDIDSDNFLYVKKIELFTKNFIYQDDTKPADIFISNLIFQAAYRIPDEEFAGTALNIVIPERNHFIASENLTSKKAIAQLRIKGKITDSLTKNIQYYWFIEDLRVDKSDNLSYHKYGGRGWRCLNKYNITEGTDENPISIEYVSEGNTFIIEKSNSNARETKYKCVINYNNQILSKEFSFINYDINEEVYILCDREPNFTDSIGATTLSCMATNAKSYKWAKIDAEGGFEALQDTAANNKEYENAVNNYNQLQKDIENKTKPNNATNQALLNSYLEVIQKYNNIERRKENQIINLQAGSIFQEATYKCQAFDSNRNSLGIASQIVTNNLSGGENLQTGSLIINNGSQVFKYNAKGIAPTSEQFDEPQIILPLSFTLRNAEGLEIPETALRDTDITWIVPVKNTMVQQYLGSLVSHDEELGIEVYNGKNLSYTINENYYANKDNNEIELQVQYQGLTYVAKTNLYFIKDGENGTNGTEYVLKILPNTDTIGRLKMVKGGQTGSDWLRIQLWYNGIKIYEGTKSDDGTNVSTGKKLDLTWEMVGENKDVIHNITVKNNGINPPNWNAVQNYKNNATDIVKAIVEYDGMRIVATSPIIYSADWHNENYKVSLKEGTGYTHVVYSEDGLTPNYDSHTPFEISIHKLIGGQWGDITGHNSLSYKWSTIGSLKIKNGYEDLDANKKPLGYSTLPQVMFEPVGKYNSEETHHAIICVIKEGSATIGTLHIPVHFLLNTYGHSALNEWDGNSIRLDADGNTMLLAPQGGFGKKESNNSYTGVLLGTVKDYTNGGLEHTGMFGYSAGTRTMFLNSENGSAIFGSTGSSQIMIDPTAKIIEGKTGAALLYSNDFYKSYDTKTGLPSSYANSNENGKGALIDLTTPQIRWGNGNFKVNKDGHITAKGGGDIAGWYINNTELYKGDVHFSSDNTTATNWAIKIGNNNSNPLFGVNYNGLAQMQTAQIGSGSNQITIGKENGSTTNSAIYRGKNSLKAAAAGFYLGNNGLALGTTTDYKNITNSTETDTHSKFEVTSSGTVYASDVYLKGRITATSGYIGNGSSGWTIGNTYIHNNKTGRSTTPTSGSTGVYIGTNGIGLGPLNDYKNITGATSADNHSKFEVTNAGVLYAKDGYFDGKIVSTSGKIGGWTIGSTYLRGVPATAGSTDYIQINSNGSITSPKWSLNRSGAASFSSVTISGGSLNINNKFTVNTEGHMTSTSGNIGGWNIDNVQLQKTVGDYSFEIRSDRGAGDPALLVYKNQGNDQGYKFYVRPDGFLYAKTADIEGKITATSGKIGNWNISEGTIKYGDNVYLGSNGSVKFGNFSVDTNGNISATGGTFTGISVSGNSTIEGKITAGSGKIGGWTISGNDLKCGNTTLSGGTSYGAGKLVWKSGNSFFAAGAGSDHPVASSFSTNGEFAIYSGLGINGGGSYVGKFGNDGGKITIEGNSGVVIQSSGTIGLKPKGANENALEITSDSIVRANGLLSAKNGFSVNGKTGISKTISGGVVIGQTDINLVFTYGILTSASGNWVSN